MYYCKNCGVQIPDYDVDPQTAIGRCNSCCAVVNFSEHPNFLGKILANQGTYGSDESYELAGTGEKKRMQVPMPASITVEQMGRQLKITRKWFNYTYIFMAFFCVFWDGFLLVWYTAAIAAFLKNPAAIMMCLFPLIHLAVGVGITYSTLAGFLNKTFIDVSDYELSISHTPLPWSGAQKIGVDQLEQLYCQENTSRSRNGTTRTYAVNAILKGTNRKVTLLSGLPEAEQALFIEQEVEKYLKIVDRHVPGEMNK
jgi:hypothetical protein